MSPFLNRFLSVLLSIIVPLNMWMSFHPAAKIDPQVRTVLEKTDGFIKGVCHTEQQYDLLSEAHIGWTRLDIPFPFDADGNLDWYYQYCKAEMQDYADHGIKVFAVTPTPDDYIRNGLDPRDPESKEKIQEVARFYVNDLKGIAGAFQISNEVGVDRFTLPLTIKEAVDFIGMQAQAMYEETRDTDIIIGYNIASPEAALRMLKYNDYLDYVGLDAYFGCFEEFIHDINLYQVLLGLIRMVTQKPLILCEFGYIGYGKALTEEEKAEVLRSYGYNSKEEAIADMDNFIDKLPERIGAEMRELYPDASNEEYGEMIFNGEYTNHFYCALPADCKLNGYEHTPEGQAKFYSDLIPKLRNLDYLVGAVVYCWKDSEKCYVCGQETCPVETGWGLIDGHGEPKPSYYAVKKGFEN
ncbi:MAG: hypothetical protein IKH65_08760 [Clostridia bacterium]|nr:hypothetical protein [Clostridia bacterium]